MATSETNRHHLYWPKRDYRSPTEKAFRSLPCNIVEMNVNDHRILHLVMEPPTKPTFVEMTVAIQRHKSLTCGCI